MVVDVLVMITVLVTVAFKASKHEQALSRANADTAK